MECKDLNLQSVLDMKTIKDKKGYVHYKNNIIYKIAEESKEILDELIQYKDVEELKNLAYPIFYLYERNRYYGYAMTYYQDLYEITKKTNKGNFNTKSYFLELITMLEKMKSLNLIYYDLHTGNVKVTKDNHPFLLDIDHTRHYSITMRNLQLRLLYGFISNAILGYNIILKNNAINPEVRKILNEKIIHQLDIILSDRYSECDLPYLLLEELENKEKRKVLKKVLKQQNDKESLFLNKFSNKYS